MVKRDVGQRPKILIDGIDLEILEITQLKPISVLELASKLKIQHKNLKPHLEKLIKSKLVLAYRNNQTRKITLISRGHFDDDSEAPNRENRSFIKILRAINKRDFAKETLYDISRELNEAKGFVLQEGNFKLAK